VLSVKVDTDRQNTAYIWCEGGISEEVTLKPRHVVWGIWNEKCAFRKKG
jgi:hypothetical protein